MASIQARKWALFYVSERFHSGQWSRGYRFLSRIQPARWGISGPLLPRDMWEEERSLAARYIRQIRAGELSL